MLVNGSSALEDLDDCSDSAAFYDAIIYISIMLVPISAILVFYGRSLTDTPRRKLLVARCQAGCCGITVVLLILLLTDIPGLTCFKSFEAMVLVFAFSGSGEYDVDKALRLFDAAKFCAVASCAALFVAAMHNFDSKRSSNKGGEYVPRGGNVIQPV